MGKPQILVSSLFSYGRSDSLEKKTYLYAQFLALEHKYGCWPSNGRGNRVEGLTVQLQNLYPSISRCFAFRNFLNNFSMREGDNLPALVDLGQDSHRLPRTGLCILSLRVPSIGLSTSSLIFKPILYSHLQVPWFLNSCLSGNLLENHLASIFTLSFCTLCLFLFHQFSYISD